MLLRQPGAQQKTSGQQVASGKCFSFYTLFTKHFTYIILLKPHRYSRGKYCSSLQMRKLGGQRGLVMGKVMDFPQKQWVSVLDLSIEWLVQGPSELSLPSPVSESDP